MTCKCQDMTYGGDRSLVLQTYVILRNPTLNIKLRFYIMKYNYVIPSYFTVFNARQLCTMVRALRESGF